MVLWQGTSICTVANGYLFMWGAFFRMGAYNQCGFCNQIRCLYSLEWLYFMGIYYPVCDRIIFDFYPGLPHILFTSVIQICCSYMTVLLLTDMQVTFI